MNPAAFVLLLGLTALPWRWCQEPVPIQFQTSPVLVASGSDAVFTVQTVDSVFSITWFAPGGGTLGNWIGGQAVLNPLSQYQGRVTINATLLKITASRLSDAGNYTVTVTPAAATGLGRNSRSVLLRVFDAVGPVSLSMPSLPIEGSNVVLSCSWSMGTDTKVAWSKAGTDLSSDPRVNISGRSLIISQANRNDSGQYTCSVSNPISVQSATASLTINYGPDTPQMTKTSSSCVGGGDATVGQVVQLTCSSASLPPALLSWRFNGQPLASGGSLSLQVFSTNQSGPYVCSASNSATMRTSQQQIGLVVVGTCLSVGAVAGIVVACFVALVLVIAAVVLILCQRRVDRRLGILIGHQKENLNNRPTTPVASQNGQAHRPDPPVQHVNRLDQRPSRQTDGNAAQNDTGGDPNPYVSRSSHPQQSPNVVIQTGRGEPGTQTVLINLDALPQRRGTGAQPPAVQVCLAAPQNHSTQRGSATQELALPHRQNQNCPSYPDSQLDEERNHPRSLGDQPHTGPAGANRTRDHGQPSDVVQTGYSHNRRTSPNPARYRPEPSVYSGSDASSDLGRMPWDRPRGTPAYPNRQEESSDTDESGSSQSEGAPPVPDLSGRRSSAGGPVRNHSRRDLLRQLAQGAAQRRRRDQNQNPYIRAQNLGVSQRVTAPQQQPVQTQNPSVRPQILGVSQRVTAPQQQPVQTQNPSVRPQDIGTSHRVTAPQQQTVQTQTSTPTGPSGPDQRQTFTSNPVPLTQAALQQHTYLTSNQPLPNWTHPVPRPGPFPAVQVNREGQAVPPPPPVLGPDEFRTLPREPLQRPRPLQTIRVMKRPAVAHRRANPHRHTTNPHMHANLHRHMNQPSGFL